MELVEAEEMTQGFHLECCQIYILCSLMVAEFCKLQVNIFNATFYE